jgi:hypothetical protein
VQSLPGSMISCGRDDPTDMPLVATGAAGTLFHASLIDSALDAAAWPCYHLSDSRHAGKEMAYVRSLLTLIFALMGGKLGYG